MKRPWLAPLAPLYAAGLAMRWAGVTPARLSWPVVSVGNLSVGGTGKTPFTIALVELLQREGVQVDVLSRGYGRKSGEPERVDPNGSAEQFGDEPLLIARKTGAPVYVARQRYRAGRMAESAAARLSTSPRVHLLDDGFQHRQLHRDVDILILNRQDWFEDSLLPGGDLREPRSVIQRATVIAISEDEPEIESDLSRSVPGTSERPSWSGPIWKFRREMVIPAIPESLKTRPVVAFCGIARPGQFFDGLARHGMQVAASHTFPDHHPYTRADVEMLLRLARTTGSGILVTTVKDFVRLGDLGSALDGTMPLFAADLRIVFSEEAEVVRQLMTALRTPAS
jgi:tetraacyldisaccharide 4'-kinase